MAFDSMYDNLVNKMSGTLVPDFLLYETVTSTNDLLKDILSGSNISGMNSGSDIVEKVNISEGFSVISLCQTRGKGRSGRSFFSPAECSIYFSVYLNPQKSISKLGVLTPMAASAVYDSINEVCGVDSGIKWVNDIFVNDKKVCGILTETTLKENTDIPEYVVVGIGLNVFSPKCDIPEDIIDVYGTIFDNSIEYNEELLSDLVLNIINRLMKYYYELEYKTFLESYKKGLFIVNSRVSYISGCDTKTIIVDGVDDDVNLLAHDDNGKKYKFRDGEIRLKLLRK